MKKAFIKNITAWIYTATLFIVVFSAVSSVVSLSVMPQPFFTIFQLGKGLATLLFTDLLLPLILCVIYLIDVLLYQWHLEENSIKQLLNLCLLGANLIVCFTQISFSRDNLIKAGIVSLAFVALIVLGHIIKRKRILNKASLPSREDDNAECRLQGNSIDEIKQNYAKIKADAKLKFHVDIYNEKKQQKLERLKKRNERKLLKETRALDREKERSSAMEKRGNQHDDRAQTRLQHIRATIIDIVFWIFYFSCIFIPLVFYLRTKNGEGKGNISELLQIISRYFQPFSDKEPVLAIISALGGVFLWIIALFLVFYLVVVIGRTIRNACKRTDSDERSISEAADELKIFVYGVIQSALHLILVFPDFLRATLELLFDISPVSESIEKWRKTGQSSTTDDKIAEEEIDKASESDAEKESVSDESEV